MSQILLSASFACAILLQSQPDDALKTGQLAAQYIPVIFANGVLNPHDRDGCQFPVVQRATETKVAIFSKKLDDSTIELAKALDRSMRKHKELKYSFLVISDETPEQVTTDAQVACQIANLKKVAADQGVQELSLGYLRNLGGSRTRNSLGFFANSTIVVAVIEPGIFKRQTTSSSRRLPIRTVRSFYRYTRRLPPEPLDAESADRVIAEALSALAE
jgi:hypothetical protein